ncbi:hypothetical protein AB2N08_19925 [Massilia aurea]|uniref:hypothetical protein n=1 Tax=Massilia aurea TaxID=373040 RepID=UPI0034631C03
MNVQAAIGRLGQHGARGKRIAPIGQAMNANEVGMRARQRQERLAKPGIVGIRHRRTGNAALQRRQRRAARQR